MRLRRPLVALFALTALVGGLAPSTPAQVNFPMAVTTVPQDTYVPGTVVVTREGGLTYVNLDAVEHDVVAMVRSDGASGEIREDHVRPDDSAPWCIDFYLDCPLFWSELIPGPGNVTEVLGLEDLEVGKTYDFYCSIHPLMRGTLTVAA